MVCKKLAGTYPKRLLASEDHMYPYHHMQPHLLPNPKAYKYGSNAVFSTKVSRKRSGANWSGAIPLTLSLEMALEAKINHR
jgi:hypothetical protein